MDQIRFCRFNAVQPQPLFRVFFVRKEENWHSVSALVKISDSSLGVFLCGDLIFDTQTSPSLGDSCCWGKTNGQAMNKFQGIVLWMIW